MIDAILLRMNPIKDAKEHLNHVKESYWAHGFFAVKWGCYLIWLGLTSVLHGFFPFIFKFSAPKGILKLKKLMDERNEEERIRSFENRKN